MLVMISIALAIGIYFGLKRVLWSSGTITTIALHMGCEVTQSNFFATYNRAYMYASLVWFIFWTRWLASVCRYLYIDPKTFTWVCSYFRISLGARKPA